jgi:DNA-binding transcriptional regulator YiaG
LTLNAIGRYDDSDKVEVITAEVEVITADKEVTTVDEKVRGLIAQLREKGWTMAAIADELGVDHDTVYRWKEGLRSPANAVGIVSVLNDLLQRRRIPKRRRYVGKRNPPAT